MSYIMEILKMECWYEAQLVPYSQVQKVNQPFLNVENTSFYFPFYKYPLTIK